MKKVRNMVLGGLQQKVFNLMLITLILTSAAYTAVIVYQMRSLQAELVDTVAQQQEAFEEVASAAMESVASAAGEELIRDSSEQMGKKYAEINSNAVENIERNMSRGRWTLFVLLLMIMGSGIAAALTVGRRIVRPLNAMAEDVSGLSRGRLQFFMKDEYRTGDEVEELAEAFADISARTMRYLEEVKRVTAEKERIGAELELATAIQASQLPHLFPAFPDRPEFDVYASMTPAKEVGGDFYDFFLVDHDHIGLVIADVAGKGVPAALLMMVARILIRNRTQNGESPARVLENVNDQLMEGNETGMFVTVWLAVLEISTGRGIVSNAGHEHPVLRRAGGEYEMVKYRHSPAVGILQGISYSEHEFQMYPGDSLFVFTDGVVEATSKEDELFGEKRLLKALNRDPGAQPEQILENVKDGVSAFIKDAEQFDDLTMMCLEYTGPGGVPERTEQG